MGQKNQLWWDLPAADSFELHREIYSIPPVDFRRTLDELTELLGVGALTRQAVRELSLISATSGPSTTNTVFAFPGSRST